MENAPPITSEVIASFQLSALFLPMAIAGAGIFLSIAGIYLVRTEEEATQKALLKALARGINASSVMVIAAAFGLTYWLMPDFMGVAWSIVVGLAAGWLIGKWTEYSTSAEYAPTQKLAEQTLTGPATVIIGGVAEGMLSTWFPVIVVCVATVLSFGFASNWQFNDLQYFALGLYGVGIAAVGMLSTLGITLATDAYGPIADNAGGNAEMAGLEPIVRERTDALDSLGNTTAAIAKGFAVGSAALTALALFKSFEFAIRDADPSAVLNLNIGEVDVFIGLFIGAGLPFLFAALTIDAVGRAAQKMIEEVRRQFREIPGLREGVPGVVPDSARCVAISTEASLREMIIPGALAIVVPLVTGFISVDALGGLLAGALVTGFALAIFMANSGGAWDNAKKYIEAGAHGGKGSDAHKAAVVGDTVGDPFKDTSGPSMNILIKVMTIVSLVFAGAFV
jgi:K(+)-stimulated pyrophosphate-energized sodium pump